jgi:hypothetical protein
MSLRDYFAAASLPEFLRESDEATDEWLLKEMRRAGVKSFYDFIARQCYGLADAMLAERVAKP